MTNITMSKGKFDGINACATDKGIIAAAAMDQRGSLQKAIAARRGANGEATADDLAIFKTAVTKFLTPHASAVLMDPEYGLGAIKERAANTGVLLAYEKTGYDTTQEGRLPDLLPEWSVRRLVEAGANAIKILLYYNPNDDEAINTVKHAFIERIGDECAAVDVPFFLEPVVYDDAVGDAKGLAFAKVKPDYVTRAMAEFTQERYGVDVLKVEVPVNIAYVKGTGAFEGGEAAYSRAEAMDHFRSAAAVATKPFIYLSAGVTDDIFRETIELAGEADVPFSGVLCGRATWQDGVQIYAEKGTDALEEWLADRGVQNIKALNAVLAQGAKPWWEIYGGKDAITVIEE